MNAFMQQFWLAPAIPALRFALHQLRAPAFNRETSARGLPPTSMLVFLFCGAAAPMNFQSASSEHHDANK